MTSIFAGDGQQGARRMSTAAAIVALLGGIRQWRENRRAWRQLAAMSERELQDIGLCRSDLAHHDRLTKGRSYWPP